MPNEFARHLRKNMTDAETFLWKHLRRKQINGFKFRRQEEIGPYIVDFVCYAAKLIVELDGGHHNLELNKARDERRTAWLTSQGFQVIRFWNHDVFESLEAILQVIWDFLEKVAAPPPSPTLPHKGGGGRLSSGVELPSN